MGSHVALLRKNILIFSQTVLKIETTLLSQLLMLPTAITRTQLLISKEAKEDGRQDQTVFQDNNLVRVHMLEHALKDARNQCELHSSPQDVVEEMVVTAGIHALRLQKQPSENLC